MKSIYTFILIATFILALPVDVRAQKNNDIQVGNDGPVIITLAEDAGSVIVGNPVNAYVNLETPRRILVNAGMPGMTRLVVLNVDGKTILNRNLVVGAGGNGAIRIQNACINAGNTRCQADVMYDCAEGARCNRVMPSLPPSNTMDEIRSARDLSRRPSDDPSMVEEN